MALKEPVYEAVEIGETFGPLHIDIDEHYVRQACFALDDHADWYVRPDPRVGGRIAPSAAIAKDMVTLFMSSYDPNQVVGLHQKEEVWYHAPVRFGSTVTLTGRYVDKYEKRGKGYVVLDCEAHDETGTLLVRQRSVEIMRIPKDVKIGAGSGRPSKRVEAVWPTDREPAARARADLAPGTPIVPLSKTAHQDQMAVFSGCNQHWQTIHTSLEVAKKAGFSDTVTQGMQTTTWTSEMFARFFGPSWLSSGWISMIYVQPVMRGDVITSKAVISEATREEGATRLGFEMWCENQNGVRTAVGWASALVGED